MRLIIDTEKKIRHERMDRTTNYQVNLNKEKISRDFVFKSSEKGLNFLDVGGRDGKLSYLLGTQGNLDFDQKFYDKNKKIFDEKYTYYGLDLAPAQGNERVIHGDVCRDQFLENWKDYLNFFDVIYSNNVFEHLDDPFQAAKNLASLSKTGGILIVIVPFSQRYHACPDDFFRFTHKAFEKIFNRFGKFEQLVTGYDILGRRNDWQGSGEHDDYVPEDKFGAWRETWFTVTVLRKTH